MRSFKKLKLKQKFQSFSLFNKRKLNISITKSFLQLKNSLYKKEIAVLSSYSNKTISNKFFYSTIIEERENWGKVIL
jgi:hypothetical protein